MSNADEKQNTPETPPPAEKSYAGALDNEEVGKAFAEIEKKFGPFDKDKAERIKKDFAEQMKKSRAQFAAGEFVTLKQLEAEIEEGHRGEKKSGDGPAR